VELREIEVAQHAKGAPRSDRAHIAGRKMLHYAVLARAEVEHSWLSAVIGCDRS
jgi:hypothetical protein